MVGLGEGMRFLKSSSLFPLGAMSTAGSRSFCEKKTIWVSIGVGAGSEAEGRAGGRDSRGGNKWRVGGNVVRKKG